MKKSHRKFSTLHWGKSKSNLQFYSDDAWDMMAKKPGMFPDSRDRRAAYDSSSNSYQPYGGGSNARARTSNYGQEDDTNSGYGQGRNGHWPAIRPQQNRPSYNTAKPSSGGYLSGFRPPTSATKRPSTSGYNGYGTNPIPPTATMYIPSGRSSYNPYGTPSSNPYTTSRTTNSQQCQCEDMISSNCPAGPVGVFIDSENAVQWFLKFLIVGINVSDALLFTRLKRGSS